MDYQKDDAGLTFFLYELNLESELAHRVRSLRTPEYPTQFWNIVIELLPISLFDGMKLTGGEFPLDVIFRLLKGGNMKWAISLVVALEKEFPRGGDAPAPSH
jgi:hypothetical protein